MWPAIIFAARVAHSFGGQLRELPKRNFPFDFAVIQVDRVQRAPGRCDGRIALRVKKFIVAVHRVFERAWELFAERRGELSVFGGGEQSSQRLDNVLPEGSEIRHPSATFADDLRNIRLLVFLTNL